MQDSYLTIAHGADLETKIGRSTFIGSVEPVGTQGQARAFFEKVSLLHPQATHNCPAFRLGVGAEETSFCSDAGEPSGTAGKPIIGAILKCGVSDLAVVVTRYFGGKKLGIRGLIEAYGQVAYDTIVAAGIKEKIITDSWAGKCQYHDLGKVEYLIKKYSGRIKEIKYTAGIDFEVEVPKSKNCPLQQELAPYVIIKTTITGDTEK